jgi:peptidoglycan hydrolase-like protein with peptidoglycan-binding domain
MSITNNTIVAKTAAVVAGLGLVAMSFASFAPAQAQSTTDLQAQINSLLATIASLQSQLGGSASASASVTFTRDLTIGASGADVTALQTWLISKGYSIPAGATGYFGAQTQAALAAYQAANGITPAAGYFGPITRAKVNASAGTSTGTGTGTGTTGSTSLKGGEADLSNYDLRSGDDLAEGDTNTEIASVKFDVDGGDVNVQRVRLTFQAKTTSGSISTSPWKFFDGLSVYDGSTKVGSVDAGSRSDWDQEDGASLSTADAYQIAIPVNDVVKDGDTAELSIRADAQNTIDSSDTNQVFDVYVDDQDLRAVDAAGIQEYTGSNDDHVSVGFNNASNGDLTLRESSDDPDAGVLVADTNDATDDLTVFKFEMKNDDDADALLNNLTIHVATTSSDTTDDPGLGDIIRKATLTVGGNDYDGDINDDDNTIDFDFGNDEVTLGGNDTTDFTLTIDLASQDGHYASSGESLTFSLAHGDVDAEGADTGDRSDVSGTANGNKQSIAVNGGISVEGNDMSTNLTYNSNTPSSSYGTFTVKFDVTAVGDDVYVPTGVGSTTGSSTDSGAVIDEDMGTDVGAGTTTVSMTSTADVDANNNDFYVIHDGDTETFTATVTINPTTDGTFQVGLDAVHFTSDDTDFSDLQSLDVSQTDSQFHTDPLVIPNS